VIEMYARAFYCAECGHMEDHAEDGQACPKCGCARWCKPDPQTTDAE
jgi:rubrerythrin